MKKVSKAVRPTRNDDELEAEYKFDYSQSRPNRFADKVLPGSIAVVLEPDVARVFKDAGSVNKLLRALMDSMPRT